MPELDFLVESAEPVALAVAPTLAFKLRVSQRVPSGPPAPIHAVALRCQIRFDPAKRRYTPAEGDRLRRPLWHNRPLQPDAAADALDARERRRAPFHRLNRD